eukprot:s916_g12.t3
MARQSLCLSFGSLVRLGLHGPKKAAKGAKAPAAAVPAGPPGAGQVFNIYAERPDEEIKPDSWYPNWLWKLETPPKHYGDSWQNDLTLMFVHGVNIEEATLSDYQRFLRQHRKMIIKINNLRLKRSKKRLLHQSTDTEANRQRNAFNLIGSTAIVALVDCRGSQRSVTVANCGDSRAVLCRGGKAIELSEDHKPELESEEQRIRLAGGSVKLIGPCHRIDGWGLNLSRALGDFHYKARADLSAEEQKVIAVPEIRTVQLDDEDEFLVLACDGCFELHSSQDVIDIVNGALRAGVDVKQAAEQLVDKSCSPNLVKTRGKGGDNCSAIVIKFR